MKNIVIAIFLANWQFTLSQNISYSVFNDSINAFLETNYNLSKENYLRLRNTFEFDPSYQLYFCQVALSKGDSIFFKNEIPKIVSNYGYRYTTIDSLNYTQTDLNDLIQKNNLNSWMIRTSNLFYPEWVAKNPKAFQLNIQLEELRIVDQFRMNYYKLYDVCDQSTEYLKRLDFDNFAKLLMICKENGNKVPNDFDMGINCFWDIILLHIMDEKNVFDIWKLILPYIENAYFEGKISDTYFKTFDTLLFRLRGCQYYGFIEGAPVHDNGNLEKRRAKYKF